MKLIYLLFSLGLWCGSAAWGQDTYYQPGQAFIPGTYDFIFRDGSQLRGQLVRSDSVSYLIRTKETGDRSVRIADIVRADLVGGTLRSGQNTPNGFPFRLFFFPTAVPIPKKQIAYQNSYLLFSRVDIGITKHWSAGAGFQTLRPQNFFTISTKFAAKVRPKTHVGLSVQYIGMRAAEQLLSKLGFAQGIVTVGDDQKNITVGLGTVFSRRGVDRAGVLTIGYVRKITPDLTFINQNNILIGETADPLYVYLSGLSSSGIRFDNRRHAFDLAVLIPFYTYNQLLRPNVLPYMSYQIRFGR